ncbi:cation:proton antiporter [Leifsonia shinshuensis]|uniref:cation:proton antiporter n=1 Tax=Leifsonia shinshuensis TaxID=150026 RepID=UPI00285DE759|nr:cation:proton antiporter [Leifsonia shinshuensis]MDR6970312.1 Kef-type K+ transport system membrane component KefB [Leifsonia shinshuensis]
MAPAVSTVVLVPLIAVAAALLTTVVGRFVKIPLVVFEIVLGLIAGPSVLGWVPETDALKAVSNFGLAFLFFMAGNEIDFAAIVGRPIRRASLTWLISLIAGIVLATLIVGQLITGVYLGIALTSTALGTLMPVLRDAGELRTPFGRVVIAVGAVGEFGPLIAISLFLSGRKPLAAALVLIGFAIIAGAAIWFASRGGHERFQSLVRATLHTSGQFAVRFVVLVIAALVGLSIALGLDMLLGAFAAGVLCRILLGGAAPEDAHHIESKLEAVAFGVLVPVFFINTGIGFDLKALLGDPRALLLLPIFLVLLVVVRGLPGSFAAPPGSTGRDRAALTLFTATGLPIIVAVTDIGVREHDLQSGTATALVGAGMLSVLIFPLVALLLRRRSADGGVRPADPDAVPIEG